MASNFDIEEYPLQEETSEIIKVAYEVHRELGIGLLEIVYKDALEYEFKTKDIFYSRESKYEVPYKDIILKHHFYADFVIFDKVILEVKAKQGGISDDDYAKAINYLRISECKVGLIINFGTSKLGIKRVIF